MKLPQFAVIFIKSKYISNITFQDDEASLFKYIRSLYHVKCLNKLGRRMTKKVIVLEWNKEDLVFREIDEEMRGRIMHQYELEDRNAKLRERKMRENEYF